LNEAPHSTGNLQGALADGPPQQLLRDRLALDVEVHRLLVILGHLLHQVLPGNLGPPGQVLGDLVGLGHPVLVAGEGQRLHRHQVDHARERVLAAHRQLHRHRVGRQPLAHHRHRLVEVGAHPVHLVDEGDARDVVAVGLAPHRLALRLDPAHRAEQRHRAVQDSQRTLDLDREVDMARGVDDVDPVVAPGAGGGGRGDGDAALLFLLHPVHGGGAVVDLSDAVRLAGVEQYPLGGGGLPGIDVGHDADVPGLV
jgi:hypothetical protein